MIRQWILKWKRRQDGEESKGFPKKYLFNSLARWEVFYSKIIVPRDFLFFSFHLAWRLYKNVVQYFNLKVWLFVYLSVFWSCDSFQTQWDINFQFHKIEILCNTKRPWVIVLCRSSIILYFWMTTPIVEVLHFILFY